jgi:hypothetical protein
VGSNSITISQVSKTNVVPSIIAPDNNESQLKSSTEVNSEDGHPLSPSTSQNQHNHHRHSIAKPRNRDHSLALPIAALSNVDLTSLKSGNTPQSSLHGGKHTGRPAQQLDDEIAQDIKEVWLSGGHADIGGGWAMNPDETWPLSHTPLVWMVQGAEKAGLSFDREKMKEMQCCEEDIPDMTYTLDPRPPSKGSSTVAIDFARDVSKSNNPSAPKDQNSDENQGLSPFLTALRSSSTRGYLHDPLSFKTSTLPTLTVLSWRVMEFLPFRRMDLQLDGSWKTIRWPLPKGEVRDIPATALIHNSVIERMKANKDYRPGNLIVGGAGGRGVKQAPESWGMGVWVSWENEAHPVREVFVRRGAVKFDDNGGKVLVGLEKRSYGGKGKKVGA